MIILAFLLILFTCWILLGLFVGESCDIRWIRHWCGGIFVTMVALISLSSGFLIARVMERSSARSNAFEALQVIADRIEAGDDRHVIRKIRALDHRGDPDQDTYDLLDELPQLVAELHERPAPARTVAEDPAAEHY